MIKNSTIVIAASIVMMGVVVNGIIDNVFERKNLEDKNKIEIELKKLEVNKSLLSIEPRLFKTDELNMMYLPKVNFKNGFVNIEYVLYRNINGVLVEIPIH